MHSAPPLCGIFIGGQSRRMGGHPKGLLSHPKTGQPLLAYLRDLAAQAGLDCVLVGQRPEYAHFGLPMLADTPAHIGPLGGLFALLSSSASGALVLSCDLPSLSFELLLRLSTEDFSFCDVLAPQRDGRFEPLFARYHPAALPALTAAIAAGERSFQQLFRRLRVARFAISKSEERELDDWDNLQDVPLALRP